MTAPTRAGRSAPVPVIVAPMRTKDLRGVLRIEEAVFPQPWSHRLFVEELAQRKSRAYRAAWVGATIVGFAGLMFIDDEAHVNNIAVDPAWQGRGLGAVLSRPGPHALERGCPPPHPRGPGGQPAGPRPSTAGSGWPRSGCVRNYYPETGEDALIMWARDIDSETYAGRLDAIEAVAADRVRSRPR